MLADLDSGATHELLAIPGENLGSPRLSGDNTQLFFVRNTNTASPDM